MPRYGRHHSTNLLPCATAGCRICRNRQRDAPVASESHFLLGKHFSGEFHLPSVKLPKWQKYLASTYKMPGPCQRNCYARTVFSDTLGRTYVFLGSMRTCKSTWRFLLGPRISDLKAKAREVRWMHYTGYRTSVSKAAGENQWRDRKIQRRFLRTCVVWSQQEMGASDWLCAWPIRFSREHSRQRGGDLVGEIFQYCLWGCCVWVWEYGEYSGHRLRSFS